MPNDYFNHKNANFPTRGKAFSATLNLVFNAITAAFAKLPALASFYAGTSNFATTSGSSNNYTATINATYITSLTDGLQITVKANFSNTDAATLNLNSLGVKSIIRADGNALTAGDLLINKFFEMAFSTTDDAWILLTYIYDPAAAATNPSVNQITSITNIVNGKSYAEYFRSKEVTVDIAGGTATIDLQAGDVHYLDMDANCALAFTNAPAAGEAQTSLFFVNNQASYTFSGLSGTSFDIKIVSGATVTQPTASGKDLYILTIIPAANVLLVGHIPNWVAP